MPLLPSNPGILIDASKVLDPSGALSSLEFAKWYESTHIPAVQATGAVSRTLHYESLSFMDQHRSNGRRKEVPENINLDYNLLSIYFMPDLSLRDSEEFKNVIGEGHPSGEDSKLLERLLMQTEFYLRLCESLDTPNVHFPARPPPFLVTFGLSAHQGPPTELREKVIGRFKVRESAILSEYEWTHPSDCPEEVMMIASNSVPDFSKLDIADDQAVEIGVWGLKREYDGSEKQPAHWRPNLRI